MDLDPTNKSSKPSLLKSETDTDEPFVLGRDALRREKLPNPSLI